MAEYLASIFGTEKDKVNCSFYFKIGACRHGDRCSRIHNKPTFSQTILLQNLYQNPQNVAQSAEGTPAAPLPGAPTMSDEEAQEHFDNFFEDVFVELEDKYGEIEEMNVCDNLGDHLVGNVYVKFRNEEDADKAVKDLNNRWFGQRPIYAELSPVTDFREACCRQYEMGECTRSGFCNFMHLKPISRELRKILYGRRKGGGRRSRSRSRERSRERRRRSRSRERDHKKRGRSPSKGRDKDSKRSRDKRSKSREKRSRSKEKRSGSHDRKSRDVSKERKLGVEIKKEQRSESLERGLYQRRGSSAEREAAAIAASFTAAAAAAAGILPDSTIKQEYSDGNEMNGIE